ncbi:Hypothetical predicted protein [Mytilus galloprovincialis]|uniref:Uncharacterized protein n=1 Tax=Mytilus galloprovincialis TaxID=29158 RepID=A0A8B6CA71_MYTGA|nr:Hypothetical predicted protein [Mytilus galloprovincialis]
MDDFFTIGSHLDKVLTNTGVSLASLIHLKFGRDDIIDIVTANNDNTWIFTDNLVSLYNRNGVVRSMFTPPVNSKRMLRKSADELWFWNGQSASKRVSTQFQDGYKVPFKGGVV